MTQIDYFVSLVSPFTYIGHNRFVEIAGSANATVMIRPVDMVQIFSKSGGVPVAKRPPARQSYRFRELKRWREHLNLELNLEPVMPWPCSTSTCLSLVTTSSGLCRLFAISGHPVHEDRTWTNSMGVDQDQFTWGWTQQYS